MGRLGCLSGLLRGQLGLPGLGLLLGNWLRLPSLLPAVSVILASLLRGLAGIAGPPIPPVVSFLDHFLRRRDGASESE